MGKASSLSHEEMSIGVALSLDPYDEPTPSFLGFSSH
jgi:hypothetical protein